jgi:hypothetical protein
MNEMDMSDTKSSLKTFLAGENPYDGSTASLKGASWLHVCVANIPVPHFSTFRLGTELWDIDVLGDGTAITYCHT